MTLAQDAEAVVEALGGDTQEKEEEEEMLLDVQFPECGSQDSLDSISDTTKTSKDSEVCKVYSSYYSLFTQVRGVHYHALATCCHTPVLITRIIK